MSPEVVVGFVGMPGAGKSTAIGVASEFGPVVTMGDVVRAELKERGLPNNSENLGRVARALREEHGPMVVAERCVEMIRELDDEVVIVDGIRSMSEVNLFREAFGRFPVVAVLADDEKRHAWLMERGREDDPKEAEKIRERDEREVQFGILDVLSNADYSVRNDGTPELLRERTMALLKEILGRGS
ncbi:MAG: AAA family ATPase [Promethearchaeota archaeon]